MPKTIAVIGGTGLCDWPGAELLGTREVETAYGAPSAPIHQMRYKVAHLHRELLLSQISYNVCYYCLHILLHHYDRDDDDDDDEQSTD